ncbi:tripartite tricarboxylate transporter TctB family protein [Thalassococcus sp. S3]|uniref:tripartite tricarboxylate transporter TctB family protein n=1 Tax=Thalassococcus sp. S3 TaxID=2017482 RepID=UPI0010242768|nr:tripartite tricarboxylate transporter TctB family protein [Thalassococcus sp. S3]QBF33479.1 hypothetical protein CFI11_20020 [Thalassococcus sp. S3]
MTRVAVPIGLILFCGIAYWQTTQFDRVPPILLRGMQPSDFPQLVLLLIIGLCLLLLLQAWRGPQPDPADPEMRTAKMSASLWKTMGLFAIFAVLAPIDLFLGLAAFGLCLALVWGERRIWALALVAVVAPTLVFFLFDQVFEVRFPRGLLTNLWYR